MILALIIMAFNLEKHPCILVGFSSALLLSFSFSFTVSLWIQPIGSRKDVELLMLQFLPAALGSISVLSVLFSLEGTKRQEVLSSTETLTSGMLS